MPHSAGGENFGSGSFRNGIVVIEVIVYDAGNNELAAISKLLKPHGIAAERQNRTVNFTGGQAQAIPSLAATYRSKPGMSVSAFRLQRNRQGNP